jgi:hypothetical protein
MGHPPNDPNKIITADLGQEWSFPQVWHRLAEISAEYSGIWFDQLCISQNNPEGIAGHLAQIPNIFTTLQVVVLFPGSLCTCLSRHVEKYDYTERHAHVDSQSRKFSLFETARACRNALGFSSWFDRLWTAQEMNYASSALVCWNIKTPASCVMGPRSKVLTPAEIEMLSPYASCFLKKQWSFTGSLEIACCALYDMLSEYFANGGRAFTSYRTGGLDLSLLLVRFLTGQRIEKPPGFHLEMHFNNIYELRFSRRRASLERDFVVAVWVDLYGYAIPPSFMTMTTLELLEDAIQQVEDKLETAYVGIPVGLIADMKPSFAVATNNHKALAKRNQKFD